MSRIQKLRIASLVLGFASAAVSLVIFLASLILLLTGIHAMSLDNIVGFEKAFGVLLIIFSVVIGVLPLFFLVFFVLWLRSQTRTFPAICIWLSMLTAIALGILLKLYPAALVSLVFVAFGIVSGLYTRERVSCGLEAST